MNTVILKNDTDTAAEIINSGGLVAVPTETVYGLAVNALDEKAVARLYEVKGRPEVKPLSVMLFSAADIDKYCEDVPKAARALAEKFWPGPLTIVLRSRPLVPDIVRAGGATVGLRCPKHPLTLELLGKSGVPLAAPSANPSGKESPRSAREVTDYFNGKIDAVLDGGACALGAESTVIDMSRTPYSILRAGALPEDEIAAALASRLTVVGITGPSGAGKTTALEVLQGFGALVIDCDAVYHELLSSDDAMLGEIRERFPESFENGVFARKKLGGIVFSDGEALKALERITHKYVHAVVKERLSDWAMAGGELAAVDAIALIESGLSELCFPVVGITAPERDRIERIRLREGISQKYAALRVGAQKPDVFFREGCDCIIENTGDLEEFLQKCGRLFSEIGGDPNAG